MTQNKDTRMRAEPPPYSSSRHVWTKLSETVVKDGVIEAVSARANRPPAVIATCFECGRCKSQKMEIRIQLNVRDVSRSRSYRSLKTNEWGRQIPICQEVK